jgi:hypothetical protein
MKYLGSGVLYAVRADSYMMHKLKLLREIFSTRSVTRLYNESILRSNCKRQNRPLVREGAPPQQTRNCLTVTKIWSWAPYGCLTPRQTGRLTVGRNMTLWVFSSGAAAEWYQPARIDAVGHGSRGRYIVGSRYEATQWRLWLRVCDSNLYIVVTSCVLQRPINPITNPNPVYSLYIMWHHHHHHHRSYSMKLSFQNLQVLGAKI